MVKESENTPYETCTINIVVAGDSGVGKTKLIDAYFSLTESNKKIRQGNEFFMAATLKGYLVKFYIYDVAGVDLDGHNCLAYYAKADLVLLCFSIKNKIADLEEKLTKQWLPEIERYCPSKVSLFLVGNKVDLRYEDDKKNFILHIEGTLLAYVIEASKYFECSALNKTGVKEIFEAAVKCHLEKTAIQKSCPLQ